MTQETISAFGAQWQRYDHTGPSLEDEYLQNVLGPVLSLRDLAGKTVADVGAGNGRFTAVLAKYAKQVVSVEPAPEAMQNNQKRNHHQPHVHFVPLKAEDLKSDFALDYVFCIGVLHHIPDMPKALKGLKNMLKPDGKIVLWLYGKEGNEGYIFCMNILKAMTTWIPDRWLVALSRGFVHPVKAYSRLTRQCPFLPMAGYFNRSIAQLSDHEIELIIFDQLNPTTAYYLSRPDIEKLLTQEGFTDFKFYHRHQYS